MSKDKLQNLYNLISCHAHDGYGDNTKYCQNDMKEALKLFHTLFEKDYKITPCKCCKEWSDLMWHGYCESCQDEYEAPDYSQESEIKMEVKYE